MGYDPKSETDARPTPARPQTVLEPTSNYTFRRNDGVSTDVSKYLISDRQIVELFDVLPIFSKMFSSCNVPLEFPLDFTDQLIN